MMNETGQKLQVKAQFQEMLDWLGRGWKPAPAGRSCPDCRGPVWVKLFQRGKVERHSCVYCDWSREYVVK